MTKSLVVLPQAESDLRAAAGDYELQAPGLARAFIHAVREAFNHIERTPRLYSRVDDEVRRALLHRFPYGVFYEEQEELTRVLCVLDLRRDPRRLLSVVRARSDSSDA